jgi:ketosteroid isomerase-like protein
MREPRWGDRARPRAARATRVLLRAKSRSTQNTARAMSRENVELVLGSIQPGPDVDFVPLFRDDAVWAAAVEATAPLFHTDFEIVARDMPGGDKAYTGLDGMKAVWLDWLTPWATYRAEVKEAIDLGERVLLLYHSFGRLEGSTTEVKDELASLWTVHDGRIAAVEFYATSHAEALEALGLAE